MSRGKKGTLLSGASALFLGFLGSAVGYAQEVVETPGLNENDDLIIVTGIRRSLQNAQDIKRNADTFVDSITASDIGALPDRSVTEALQRVPGVTISHFANGNDSDRFSVEGSGVLIRGLDRVRTELNGRDVFSATNGRGLSFEDVPAELMAGVDVYKNQSANMIEGGIAGTVSLRTRTPFDAEGRLVSLSADASYGDLAKEWTPSFSALFSDRIQTSRAGEFGFLLNVSTSELKSQSHAIQIEPHFKRPELYVDGTPTSCSVDADLNPATPEEPCYFMPRGFAARMTDYDRKRTGYSAAAQWESPDGAWRALYQFNKSDGQRNFLGRYLAYDEDGSSFSIQPPQNESFSFNNQGTFTNGTLLANLGWRAYDPRVNPAAQNFQFEGGGGPYGQWHSTGSEMEKNHYVTTDHSARLQFDASERLRFNFEAQYVESTVDFVRFNPELWFYAVPTADTSGDYPAFEPSPVDGRPDFLNPAQYWWNKAQVGVEQNEGEEFTYRADVEYDVDAGWISSVQAGARAAQREQITRSAYSVGFVGNPWGCCNDGDFPGYWPGPELSNAAWADRYFSANPPTTPAGDTPPNLLANAAFLARAIELGYVPAGSTAQNANFTIYDLFARTSRGSNETEAFNFDNFFRGDTASPGSFLFPAASMYDSPLGGAAALGDLASLIPGNSFRALQQRSGLTQGLFRDREINNTREETVALYAMANFEGELGMFGRPLDIDGNIGVRYVKTETEASGRVAVAGPTEFGFIGVEPECSLPNPTPREQAIALTEPTCYLPANLVAFATEGQTDEQNNKNEYENVLPSFNIKIGLTEDMLVRFAASKAINRPDLGLLRNFVTIRPGELVSRNAAGEVITANLDPDGAGGTYDPGDCVVQGGFATPADVPQGCIPANVTFLNSTTNTAFTASAFGNPQLEAEEATQLDLAFEWYFSDVGSLTATVFQKKITNWLGNEVLLQNYTNNGVTQTVAVNRPFNGDEGELRGYEIGYQQFYDFLPSPFDGIGAQFNYTYVDNKSVPVSNLSRDGGLLSDNGGRIDEADPRLPLPGLSEKTYNVAALYEKGRIEARLAYNWRSDYLLTAYDTGNLVTPVWHGDYGQLDGSFFVKATDWLKLGVQGVNLLDETAETYIPAQEADPQTGAFRAVGNFDQLFPRSYFVTDRRVSFIARATF